MSVLVYRLGSVLWRNQSLFNSMLKWTLACLRNTRNWWHLGKKYGCISRKTHSFAAQWHFPLWIFVTTEWYIISRNSFHAHFRKLFSDTVTWNSLWFVSSLTPDLWHLLKQHLDGIKRNTLLLTKGWKKNGVPKCLLHNKAN